MVPAGENTSLFTTTAVNRKNLSNEANLHFTCGDEFKHRLSGNIFLESVLSELEASQRKNLHAVAALYQRDYTLCSPFNWEDDLQRPGEFHTSAKSNSTAGNLKAPFQPMGCKSNGLLEVMEHDAFPEGTHSWGRTACCNTRIVTQHVEPLTHSPRELETTDCELPSPWSLSLTYSASDQSVMSTPREGRGGMTMCDIRGNKDNDAKPRHSRILSFSLPAIPNLIPKPSGHNDAIPVNANAHRVLCSDLKEITSIKIHRVNSAASDVGNVFEKEGVLDRNRISSESLIPRQPSVLSSLPRGVARNEDSDKTDLRVGGLCAREGSGSERVAIVKKHVRPCLPLQNARRQQKAAHHPKILFRLCALSGDSDEESHSAELLLRRHARQTAVSEAIHGLRRSLTQIRQLRSC